MIALITRQIVTTLVVFVGVILLIFGGTATLPTEGPPSCMSIRPSPDDAILWMHRAGQPLLVQFREWLFGRKGTDAMTGQEIIYGGVIRGNLGYSRSAGKTTIQVVRERLTRTLELILLSLPLMAAGAWCGMHAAFSQGRFKRIVRARISLSIPAFILGWLIIILVQRANWFIVGEIPKEVATFYGLEQLASYTGMLTVDALLNGRPDVFVFALQHTVLPVLTLSLVGWVLLFQVTRSAAMAALRSREIIAMRGRGLPENLIVKEFIRPKVRATLLAASGYLAFALLDNVLIVEALFRYPGLGALMAQAAAQLDLLTVLEILLLIATASLALKLLIEIAQIIFARRPRSWRSISSAAQAKV
ncbi:Dipeptide transport system permease protein DppB [Thermoflexales bacterium]|nr:Dipeptide transport system permease protein DppB [Thermoflexales bacterium]